MTVDDTSGSGTICSRGLSGLFADDLGVTLRNFPRGARRFAWSDISHFADGAVAIEHGDFAWVLLIVPRAGRIRPVSRTTAASAAPGLLALSGRWPSGTKYLRTWSDSP
jgi:hypothetical protein